MAGAPPVPGLVVAGGLLAVGEVGAGVGLVVVGAGAGLEVVGRAVGLGVFDIVGLADGDVLGVRER